MRRSTIARARLAAAAALLIAGQGGCGSVCEYGLRGRLYVQGTLGCCGASLFQDVSIGKDDAEVDLSFAKAAGPPPPAHAWLTTSSCTRLFEGTYPPPTGSPAPLCTVYLGPVTPGEVSSRRKVSPGTYRVWVQAWTSAEVPLALQQSVDVGLWGEHCGARAPSL
jgi:hypothetical protein